MSDAAGDEIQIERKHTGKEFWGKGIVLVRIWREVLGFISGRDRDRLNEFKREMWLLLVAAGSGYLARCWHRTLTAKPQLTDYAHADGEVIVTNEEATTSKSTEHAVLEEPSPNVSLKKFTATLETELAPRPAKRSFSPKAISKKLFHSDSTKHGKAGGKKEGQAKSSAADERSGDNSNSASTSGAAVVGHRKKGPWSTFKSKKSLPSKANASGVENLGNSPSPLRVMDDLSHKSSRDQRTFNGSSSSRSLQSYFDEGELDTDSVVSSSPGQSGRSQSGAFASTVNTPEVAETIDEASGSVSSGEVSSKQPRRNVVANEVRPLIREQQSDSANAGSKWKDENALAKKIAGDSNELASRRDGATSVAEVVAQIEKGNLSTTSGETSSRGAAHRRRAALKANGEGAVREKVRSVKDLVEEVEVQPGGKGKRRAADAAAAKGAMDAEKVTLSGALLTGKRTKDFEEDASKLGPREAVGFTLANITGKRLKDVDKAKNDRLGGEALSPGEPFLSSTVGSVDLSQVFFGFDEAFLGSVAEEKSPSKYYKRSRHVRANTRRMRESPKPVSALESCLRAQFPEKEEESRVARSLNFSSSLVGAQCVTRRDSLEVGAEATVSKTDSLSPSVSVEDSRASDGTEQQASTRTQSPLGLPVLKASPSKGSTQRADHRLSEKRAQQTVDSVPNYPRSVVLEDRGRVVSCQSRLNDVLWRRTTLPSTLKKRKVSQACAGSVTSSSSMKIKGYELEALVIPPMEGLLFSFGVGIGVMSLTGETDSKIERLNTELGKSKEEIENLNKLLKQARESPEKASATVSTQVMVVGSLAIEKVTGEVSGSNDPLHNGLGIPPIGDETGVEMFDLVRKEAPETPQQTEHMAELEAELEAELDALTCGVLDGGGRSTLIFDELDPEGVAGVADRDLGVEGLPALLDWDDDNDDFITEEYSSTVGGVPPRELRRLLRKVQSSRQELTIAELETDLHETVNKLQAMEKELQRLRESSTPAAGAAALSSTGIEAERPESSAAAISTECSGRLDDTSSPKARDKIVSSVVPPSDEEASPKLDIHNVRHNNSVMSNQLVEQTEKSRNEPIEGTSPRHEPELGLREALVRELSSSPLSSRAREPELNVRRSASVEVGSSLRRSITTGLGFDLSGQASPTTSVVSELNDIRPGQANARSLLRDKSADLGAQADNDAVFDEFLSSVFASEDEGGQSLGSSSVVSNPRVTSLPKVFSLDEADFPNDDDDGKPAAGVVDLQGVRDVVSGKPVDDDLDQVVGELLKRDTSSVKNALNAFLLWEAAETENVENKDGVDEKEVEKERSPRYSRRAAGKNPTPQKTLSAAGSPLQTSILASRLEQLARASFTTEKMPHLDSRSPRRRGTTDQKTQKVAGEDDLDVFQPPVPQPEERTVKLLSRRDRQPSITRDMGAPLSIRRDPGAPLSRRQSLSSEGRREVFKSETPVFGSAGKDFETLLEARREMRYSSSRVDLSAAKPAMSRVDLPAAKPATQEQDVRPSRHRQREDASRAGTNSPTGRNATSTAPFYPSPKPKNSRLGFENRLYKNPTSDWIAEVGSPPHK